MNIYWMCVFVATFFEVMWVIGLKHSVTMMDWIGTVLCIVVTFVLLTIAGKKLPIGTTYTVFTGIGTVGTVLSDIVFFGEELKAIKIIFIVILIFGVVGLKVVTKDHHIVFEESKA